MVIVQSERLYPSLSVNKDMSAESLCTQSTKRTRWVDASCGFNEGDPGRPGERRGGLVGVVLCPEGSAGGTDERGSAVEVLTAAFEDGLVRTAAGVDAWVAGRDV